MPDHSTDPMYRPRAHRRVECFRVAASGVSVPVWVFAPADVADGLVGLVVDVSEGGLQVLTGAEEMPSSQHYDVELLLGEAASVERFRCAVTRIWTRPAPTRGQLSGLRLEQGNSSAEQFIRAYRPQRDGPRWVRCLLRARV